MNYRYIYKKFGGRFAYTFYLIFLSAVSVFADANFQGIQVTGKVISSMDQSGLPGVNVALKDGQGGTITDIDGNYTLQVPNVNTVLVFSYVGYITEEILVGNQTVINLEMVEDVTALTEVVVTALGIEREEKSLGYSVAKVDGKELTRVVNENVLNSMAGKVAGVTINSTGGTGSSVSMVIRGATSLSTDNQPLFVVDGVPITSTVNNVGGFGSDNRVDYGNAISDLDPESIENVAILKGPSAAALYGTRAGNGVVLITTKKAKYNQKMRVTVNSNTVFDIPSRYVDIKTGFATGFFSFRPEDVGGGVLPDINASDGAFSGPETDKGYWAVQWDAPLDANRQPIPTEVVSYPDNIRNFLNDYAFTTTNGVSIASGSQVTNFRLSVNNMTHSGLIPNSDLHRNNVSLAASSKLSDKLTVSTDINFVNSWADNRPASNRGSNPLQWAYAHPANIDITKLQDYETGGSDILRVSGNHENPYFLANDVNNSFNRYRIFGNVVANWQITPAFSVMGRYSLNKSDGVEETKIAPGYTREPNNGAYGIATSNGLESNMDVLGTYKKDWEDFSVSASIGGNLMYQKWSNTSNSSKSGSGLIVPNVFTIQNISNGALSYSNSRSEKAINSVYAMANLSWRYMLFLDLGARNDWSSTLPPSNRSYFYPSASLSFLLNEVVEMGKVDMLKLRGGWAQVGNDTGPYRLNATYGDAGQWGDATRLAKPSGLLAPNLKPEQATSMEYGIDLKMFSNRLRFEGTYYTIDNVNQIFGVPLAASTGFSGVQINAGLLQSEGWEILLGGTPIQTADWRWDLDLNFTKNETRVMELTDGVEFIDFWNEARVRSISYVKGVVANEATGPEDGMVGNLYSREVRRVQDENSPYFGYPILGTGLDAEWEGEENYSKIGNFNPDFILGLQSQLSFKNFSLSMTFDWRSGGQFVSQTYRYTAEDNLSQTWLNEAVNPGALGGAASQELRDWVVANEDELLLSDRLRPVGGPSPEYGGFPEQYSGVTVYDGSFTPGVMGTYDEDGNFILQQENLGNPGTAFVPFVVSYPWDIGRANMFDADYVKLREIALSYRLPQNISDRIGMQDVNFSIYSRNIMLWAKDGRVGVDPERAFQAEGNGGFSQGVERYNVNPWVIPVGFKLGFTF
jgi:TonB-linked SusC/RagA family outer membrane protein